MNQSPWVGVALVALAIGSAIAFSLLKIPEAGIPSGLFGLAITILMGKSHIDTTKELKELRNSLRPKADDTLPPFRAPQPSRPGFSEDDTPVEGITKR